MPRFDAFCGMSNTSVSPNITSEMTMNWIPERNPVSIEGQGTDVHDKNIRCSLIRRPGLQTFVTLPKAPVRGLFPGEYRLFAVGGDHLYEVLSGGTIIDRSTPGFSGSSGTGPAGGPIGNDGRPVIGLFNGVQLLLVSNGVAYCDSGNGPVPAQQTTALFNLVIDPAPPVGTAGFVLTTTTGNYFTSADVGKTIQITGGAGFTQLTQTVSSVTPNGSAVGASAWGTAGSTGGTGTEFLGNQTASAGAFMDGYYFVVPYPRSKSVYFSEINNGKSFPALQYFLKAAYPDNISALFADHEELYTFGDLESTQVFRDTGNLDNPFQSDQGAIMHLSCQASYSVVRLTNGVAWVGQDVRRGTRRAYHAVGSNPVVVSTPAVEAQWATYDNVLNATAFTYVSPGHELWVINFPQAAGGGSATWVYDANTGWWHQWGWWTGTTWGMVRTWVHCVVALDQIHEQHYGGDYSTGQIYTMSTSYKTDDGSTMIRRRRAPHLTQENMRRFYSRFEIDCDVLGLQRIFWNRLGNGRDRIWQMDAQQPSETGAVTLTLGWSDDRTQSLHTVFTQTLDPSVDVQLSNAYLNWVDATWH